MHTQKVKLVQIKASGMEYITIPAGSFDSCRVEITSAEGGNDHSTVWTARDSRLPVKTVSTLPQAAGMEAVTELP